MKSCPPQPQHTTIFEEELSADTANQRRLLAADVSHLGRYWEEGLPIGTGRLAGMVYGSVLQERVCLNHEWLWPDRHRHRSNTPRTQVELDEVRQLLRSGDYINGTIRANEYFGGSGNVGNQHGEIDPYSTAGTLLIEISAPKWPGDCTRSINTQTGILTGTHSTGHLTIRKEYLGHFQEDLLLFRLTAEGGTMDCGFGIERIFEKGLRVSTENDGTRLLLRGAFEGGTEYVISVTPYTQDGRITFPNDSNGRLTISDTTECIVAVDIGTSAKGQPPEAELKTLENPIQRWATLRERHTDAYAAQMSDTFFELEECESSLLNTAQRIQSIRAGKDDLGIYPLLFNFGRYLMAASSHTADLPAHLQGKWNGQSIPAWFSDYHLDLNLQMNYWFVERVGLACYAEPLLRFIEGLVPAGQRAARDIYNCRGIWLPLQTDGWGACTPVVRGWSVWVGAAPWLAQHLWWRYQFSQDLELLRERVYPFLKEAALFFEDYLVRDEEGIYQVMPSHSPENYFKEAENEYGYPSICISATSDIQMIDDLLNHCIEASEKLDCDADTRDTWRKIRDHLPPMQIGSQGQLLEWNEEFTEAEPSHRHISHLWGLHPGEGISPQDRPDLANAARTTLERRIHHGAAQTEWCAAWFSIYFSRLGDGNKALEMLELLVSKFLSPSLLALMPSRIFQIDGNFGAVEAILEMLLQCHGGRLQFLPALPDKWPSGRIGGLRARGGYLIDDIVWENNCLVRARITPSMDRDCTVWAPHNALRVTDETGRNIPVVCESSVYRFQVERNTTYTLIPTSPHPV